MLKINRKIATTTRFIWLEAINNKNVCEIDQLTSYASANC
jgi:hypothetical protein